MMPENHDTVAENGIKSTHAESDASVSGYENIQTQLDEARFISSFMAEICTSLELDDICSIAARAIYKHTPYYRIVFNFSAELEDKAATFSPILQKGVLAAAVKVSATKPCSLTASPDNSLASAHLSLHDNMGNIAIYFKAAQIKALSEAFLVSVAACFSQAVRNALQHGKMKDLAMRDGLTELFNRRTFDESLASKIKCPDMRPVSLLIVDLDNFKQVNDTFGHQAGDQVLKTFAKILKESCRGQDLVARFGGEEFAIILSQTKATTAHAIAQRIRNRLEKTVFTFDDRQLQMTASIGLATCQEGITVSASNLVKQADRALYQAKRSGKNRVCVHPAGLLTTTAPSHDGESFGAFTPASC